LFRIFINEVIDKYERGGFRVQHHIFSNGSGSMYVAKRHSRGSNKTKKKDNNEKHIYIFFEKP
jgi:hypothetical protein